MYYIFYTNVHPWSALLRPWAVSPLVLVRRYRSLEIPQNKLSSRFINKVTSHRSCVVMANSFDLHLKEPIWKLRFLPHEQRINRVIVNSRLALTNQNKLKRKDWVWYKIWKIWAHRSWGHKQNRSHSACVHAVVDASATCTGCFFKVSHAPLNWIHGSILRRLHSLILFPLIPKDSF
jgi:hypothetical protein